MSFPNEDDEETSEALGFRWSQSSVTVWNQRIDLQVPRIQVLVASRSDVEPDSHQTQRVFETANAESVFPERLLANDLENLSSSYFATSYDV